MAFLLAGPVRLTGGGAELAEAASATCVMTPAKTEGPYFVDELLNRSDIRASKDGGNVQPGTPLTLTMYVFAADGDCAPVPGAQVDIWHANADGSYSDVAQNGTAGQTWLRGYQVTDADGKVTFTTIWPGWYRGRAVHIHFKVRTTAGLEFTSQLFFTDAMNAQVFSQAPYSARGNADTTDGTDSIYGTDGSSLLLHPAADGAGGYAADFSVGVTGTGVEAGTDEGDTTVGASLRSTKALRSASGRHVRIRLKATETIELTARLTRGGRTLARRKRTLRAGTRTIRLAIGGGVKAGGARLTLELTDGAGNTRRIRRTLHVPRRR